MKNLVNRILGWLDAIGKDKYQHFAVGASLASATLLAALLSGLWWWIALIVSFVAVAGAALAKERLVDPQEDLYDILATLAGGAAVWTSVLTMYFVMA